jgi:hypothetical protein
MPTSTPIAYWTGTSIPEAYKVGNLMIGTATTFDYGFYNITNTNGIRFWMGPDEELGYVIGQSLTASTQPTPVIPSTAQLGFYRTEGQNQTGLVNLAQSVSRVNNTPQTFTGGTEAVLWLTNNGYWTSASVFTDVEFVGFVGSANTTTIDISSLNLTRLDMVVVGTYADDNAVAMPLTLGYINISGGTGVLATATRYRLSYKIIQSSFADSEVVISPPSAGQYVTLVAAFRNVSFTVPINGLTYANATTGAPDPPSLVQNLDGAMIVPWVFIDDLVGTATPPSGYTLIGSPSATQGTTAAAYLYQTLSGTANPGTFSLGANNDQWVCFTMGIISNSTVQDISNSINDFIYGQFDPGSIISYPRTGTRWIDLSGTFSGGTLVGSPTFSSDSGGVFNFDGVDDYVNFLSDPSVTSSSSIQIWVRDTGATDNNIHQIVNSVGFNVGDDGLFSISKTSTNKWGVSILIGGNFYSGETTVPATTSWTNLAIVSDQFSAGALLYVNGVLEAGAGGIKGFRDPVQNVLIGTSISGTEFFPGQIGYTLFYGNSLDDSQVLQNYNATRYRYI